MADWWNSLSEEEKEFEQQARSSRSYNSLLMSGVRRLREKQEELESLTTFVVVAGLILFGLWIWHEESWQRKLDNALSGCTIPMADGNCAAWDVSQIRDKLR